MTVTTYSDVLQQKATSVLMNNYGSRTLVLVRGEGTRVWDAEGNEYLDCGSGIAVCNLGHCHPRVTRAIQSQAEKLVHVSNLYLIEPQVQLAEMLVEHSFASRVFFSNSGAEAIEGSIKLARKYAKDHGHPERYEVISLENSFHGRTLAAITATGQTKYQKGFEPLPDGFRHIPQNDIRALDKAVTEKTAALLIEPVQGEGGIRPCTGEYLRRARAICDERNILLLFDEVQTGMGRTGTLFAYQGYGIEPDVMALAKGLGNGVPLGAILAAEKCAETFSPSTHASTFGGNPLCTAAGVATMQTLLDEKLEDRAAAAGERLQTLLKELAREKKSVREVRGRGLMVGIELDREAGPFQKEMLAKGIIVLTAGPNVIRLVPPLIITDEELDRVVAALREILPVS